MRMIVIIIGIALAVAWFAATHENALGKSNVSGEEILVAIETGDIATVRKAVAQGANVNGEYVNSTPLMRAAQAGRIDMIRELLAMGANVNGTTESGFTPLMMSVMCRRPEVTEVLLDAGADPKLRSASGRSAIEMELVEAEAGE